VKLRGIVLLSASVINVLSREPDWTIDVRIGSHRGKASTTVADSHCVYGADACSTELVLCQVSGGENGTL
jgi:hypothetical protein